MSQEHVETVRAVYERWSEGVRQRGIGSTSGVPTEMRYFTLWTFRGRRVIRIESFRERAEALEAAGLSA
jgi:ketosteroid isomerase-like protein